MSNGEVTFKSDENVKVGQLILFLDNKPHAYATSATMNLNTNVIDTSNKFDGSWQSGKAGKKSFTMNSEALLTEQPGTLSYEQLIDKQIAGQPVEFEFGTLTFEEDANTGEINNVHLDKSKPWYHGDLIITSCEVQSQNGDLAKNTLQTQGSGPLLKGTIEQASNSGGSGSGAGAGAGGGE